MLKRGGFMFEEISNEDLREEHLPTPYAEWEIIEKFALTFNGYHHFDECDKLGNKAKDEFYQTGALPLTLSEVRACLFYEQRRYHHVGGVPDDKSLAYIHGLVEAIRKIVAPEAGTLPHIWKSYSLGDSYWRVISNLEKDDSLNDYISDKNYFREYDATQTIVFKTELLRPLKELKSFCCFLIPTHIPCWQGCLYLPRRRLINSGLVCKVQECSNCLLKRYKKKIFLILFVRYFRT
jgi:hypothetical protein